jgi:hypothetical protein
VLLLVFLVGRFLEEELVLLLLLFLVVGRFLEEVLVSLLLFVMTTFVFKTPGLL